MVMFEGSVIKDTGNILCTSCYTLEGDNPLILTATDVFKSIDECCNDGIDLPSLEKAAQDISVILKQIITPMLHQQHILQSDVEDKILEVELIHREIETIRADIDATTQQTSGRGRVSRRTNISIDNDRVQLLKERVNERTGACNEKRKEVEKAKDKLEKQKNSMDEWNREYPNSIIEDLINHGKSIAQPVLDYYTRNFNQVEGDIYRLKRVARACQVFNPFVLKE